MFSWVSGSCHRQVHCLLKLFSILFWDKSIIFPVLHIIFHKTSINMLNEAQSFNKSSDCVLKVSAYTPLQTGNFSLSQPVKLTNGMRILYSWTTISLSRSTLLLYNSILACKAHAVSKAGKRFGYHFQSPIHSKGKAVPLHAMEALGRRGGIAPTHSRPRH
jgi:hypothetical protein